MLFVLVSNQKSWKKCITTKNCFLVQSVYIFLISKSHQEGLAAEVRRQCEEAITWTIYSNRKWGLHWDLQWCLYLCNMTGKNSRNHLQKLKCMLTSWTSNSGKKKKERIKKKNIKTKHLYTCKKNSFPKQEYGALVWCTCYLLHGNMLSK